MKKPQTTTRRDFLRKAGAGAALLTLPGAMQGQHHLLRAERKQAPYGPNDRIRLGVIGMGIMGNNDLRTALQVPGTELVGVCDLYDGHLENARETYGKDLFTTRNYQQLLARKDIDAVIVATSDHWHDHISIAAMKAGKHVYCEKPMVHKLEEGHAVIKAQQETGKIFQVGSQRVSSIVEGKAKELYEKGEIGDLIVADIYYDRFSALGAWQYSIPRDASAKTVDWDGFVGDAPKRDFDATRFFRWRNYQDYGTGVAGDLFVHLFSGLHLITSSTGPERIFATGGLRHWKDGRDVPDLMLALYDYPQADTHSAFNVQMRVNFTDGGGGGSSVRLVGSEGVMELGWGKVTLRKNKLPEAPGFGGWDTFGTFSQAQQKEYEKWYKETYKTRSQMKGPDTLEFIAPQGYSADLDHFNVFFDGIRNGGHIVEDASFGLRAAGPPLATNLSYFENKPIQWDPQSMKVIS